MQFRCVWKHRQNWTTEKQLTPCFFKNIGRTEALLNSMFILKTKSFPFWSWLLKRTDCNRGLEENAGHNSLREARLLLHHVPRSKQMLRVRMWTDSTKSLILLIAGPWIPVSPGAVNWIYEPSRPQSCSSCWYRPLCTCGHTHTHTHTELAGTSQVPVADPSQCSHP